MDISEQDAIKLAKDFLLERCADTAEPLWDEDDFGNPIYVDIGCAQWVHCEFFKLLTEPGPTVEKDEYGFKVTLQAQTRWSHWNYSLIREYYVWIVWYEDVWLASNDFDWSDHSFDFDAAESA